MSEFHSGLRALFRRVKLIAGVVTGVLAASSAAGAYYFSDYMVATKADVKAIAREQIGTGLVRIEAEQRTTTDKMTLLQRDGAQTRLQVNEVRRAGLRNELFSRELQLKSETRVEMRQLLRQKIDEIQDDLEDVNQERARLKLSSP